MTGFSSSPLTNCKAVFELASGMSHTLFAYILHITWMYAFHDFIINICELKPQLIEKMQCEQKRTDKQYPLVMSST